MGLHGNENVDKLAKESLNLENIVLSMVPGFIDLLPLVEAVLIGEWQNCWDSGPKGRFYYILIKAEVKKHL